MLIYFIFILLIFTIKANIKCQSFCRPFFLQTRTSFQPSKCKAMKYSYKKDNNKIPLLPLCTCRCNNPFSLFLQYNRSAITSYYTIFHPEFLSLYQSVLTRLLKGHDFNAKHLTWESDSSPRNVKLSSISI